MRVPAAEKTVRACAGACIHAPVCLSSAMFPWITSLQARHKFGLRCQHQVSKSACKPGNNPASQACQQARKQAWASKQGGKKAQAWPASKQRASPASKQSSLASRPTSKLAASTAPANKACAPCKQVCMKPAVWHDTRRWESSPGKRLALQR